MIYHRRYAREREQSHTLFPSARKLLIVGCTGILAVALVGVVFFSSVFTIEFIDIKVQGGIEDGAVRSLMFSQMEQKRFWFFPQKNIFFFSSRAAQNALSQRFVLERSAITKRFPHTLRVSAIGKPFRLLLIGTGTVYDLSSDGTPGADLSANRADTNATMVYARALASSPDRSAAQPPKDDVDAPLVLSDARSLDHETVAFIREIFALSRDRGYRPVSFEYNQQAPTITMKTRQGWNVLFSSLENPRQQIKNVATILDTYVQKKDRRTLDYIDVRFDRRVFYKEH